MAVDWRQSVASQEADVAGAPVKVQAVFTDLAKGY